MKISQFIEMLENSKERLGDVEVYIYDYTSGREYKVGGINNELDHIDIVE